MELSAQHVGRSVESYCSRTFCCFSVDIPQILFLCIGVYSSNPCVTQREFLLSAPEKQSPLSQAQFNALAAFSLYLNLLFCSAA